MIQSVQLFNTAVVFMAPPKKNPHSRSDDVIASLPWTAFLVPSVPKRARREPGASAFAFSVLVGPMKSRHP